MIVAQLWLTISELICSMPDFPEIWRYNCFLIHCKLCFDSMRFCCCMCTFSQVRYGDPHLLTISFKLEFTAGAISYLSTKKFPHVHTHNSKSSLKGPPDSPIPSLNTSQILPLLRKANPPISPSQYLPTPPSPWAPWYSTIFLPSHTTRSLSALFHYFHDDQKYMTIKSLMRLTARAGPEVTPFFSSAPVPLLACLHW